MAQQAVHEVGVAGSKRLGEQVKTDAGVVIRNLKLLTVNFEAGRGGGLGGAALEPLDRRAFPGAGFVTLDKRARPNLRRGARAALGVVDASVAASAGDGAGAAEARPRGVAGAA